MSNLKLKVLCSEKVIAFALDEKIGEKINPITEYFFWPRKNAWEDLKMELKEKTCINDNEAIEVLNQTTEIINYWEEKIENTNTEIKEIKNKFPNCTFLEYD